MTAPPARVNQVVEPLATTARPNCENGENVI